MREVIRTWLCRRFNLAKLEIAFTATQELLDDERERAARRCESLAAGLAGVGLGPYGQVEYDAYKRCAATIRAPKFTSPGEVQRAWLAQAQDRLEPAPSPDA